MFEEMYPFLIGFDFTSVCFGFILFLSAFLSCKAIEAFFEFIKWFIKYISNRNSPPSGEDKYFLKGR